MTPQTPISWLNVYMQVAYLKETDPLLVPRFPQATFTQIAEVWRVRVHVLIRLPRVNCNGVFPSDVTGKSPSRASPLLLR